MKNTYETLYQVDSKGKLRFWRMEAEDGKHRTISGIVGGKEVVSGWVVCEPKNVGRSNATTAMEQAHLEVVADYKLKEDKKYYRSIEEAQEAGSGTKFLSPMLATKWEDYKGNGPFYVQPKLDGIRATITKDGMLSRAGKPITSSPHITRELEEFFHMFPDVALDGELYNHDLKHDFDRLSSLIKKQKPNTAEILEAEKHVQFHCYDVIMPGTFRERLNFRNENVDQHWCLKHVRTDFVETRGRVDELHGDYIGQGYEGSIVRLDQPYESKRSKFLMKRKDFFDAEYEIAEFVEGKGDWAGAVKAIKFRMPDGRVQDDGGLPEAGCRGSYETLHQIWKASQIDRSVIGGKLSEVVENLVPTHATVRYPNLTPRGFPRFGVVTQWHYGKREY